MKCVHNEILLLQLAQIGIDYMPRQDNKEEVLKRIDFNQRYNELSKLMEFKNNSEIEDKFGLFPIICKCGCDNKQ